MKIAVVGGGSTYTPELVDGFASRQDELPIDQLTLLDVDDRRLEVVGGLAQRILDRRGWGGRLSLTKDRDDALEGADFVVIQLRVGGQKARYVDETLPLRFGCIGQETTGPGGFAKALRTVPLVLELAEETAARGAPGAWIVDFTNPVGIVMQALLDEGHRAIGLCNVAIGLQRSFASMFEVSPDRVQLEHVGLNHLTWERRVLVDGLDRLPELLDDHAEDLADEADVPAELIQLLRMVPSYYLHYFYMTDEVLKEQLGGRTRAEEVMEIERDLLEMYADPALNEKPALLEQRGGAFYSEAAAQLIASLQADTGDVQVVDIRNDGTIPGLPDDAVVEVAARIDSKGAHPLAVAPLEPEIGGLVQQVKAYERLTVEAATSGDRSAALKALVVNPLVAEYPVAAPLLEDLLAANRDYLPRFFSDAHA
ncbi:MAG TPA: 6-phospho-beta-glucosidase [Actinomycetota bacterium]|nr:6-phospho-beta-glucosidase [Actinomycetota bacterium]